MAMNEKLKKLTASREKAEARLREIKRKENEQASKVSEQERREDVHRKILEGVTALYGCAHSEEYRRLHEQFRARALFLHKDRAIFGLPLLSDAEVERRSGNSRKLRAKKIENADAAASLSGGSASASAIEAQEAPRAKHRETEAA